MNSSFMESLKLLIIVCSLIAPSLANYARPLFPTGSLSPEEDRERIENCGKELNADREKFHFNASYISDRHILADPVLIKERYNSKVCRDNSKNVLSMVGLSFPRISKATLIGECNEEEPSGVLLMETSYYSLHGYECLNGSKNPENTGNLNSYINSIHLTDSQRHQICVASGICKKATVRHDRASGEFRDWLSKRVNISMLPTEDPMEVRSQTDRPEEESKAVTAGQALKDFFYTKYGSLMDQFWPVETTTCVTVEPTYVPAPIFTEEARVPPTYVPVPEEVVETTTCLTVEPTYVPAPIFTEEARVPPTYVPVPEEVVETTTCLTVEPTYVPAPIFTKEAPIPPTYVPVPEEEVETTTCLTVEPTYVPAPVFTKEAPIPPTYVPVPEEIETTTCLPVEPTYVPAPIFTEGPYDGPIPPTYVPAPIFTKEAPIPPTYVHVPEEEVETTTCLTVEPTYVPAPIFTKSPDDGPVPPTYVPAPIFTKKVPIPPTYVPVPEEEVETTTCLTVEPTYVPAPVFTKEAPIPPTYVPVPEESVETTIYPTVEPTYVPAPVFTKEPPIPPTYVTVPGGISMKPDHTDYPEEVHVETTTSPSAESTYMPAPVFTKEAPAPPIYVTAPAFTEKSPVPPIYVTAPIFTKEVPEDTTDDSGDSFTTPLPVDPVHVTTVEDSVEKSTKNLWDIISMRPITDSMPSSTEGLETSTLENSGEPENSEETTVASKTTDEYDRVGPTTEESEVTTYDVTDLVAEQPVTASVDSEAVTVMSGISTEPTNIEFSTNEGPMGSTTENSNFHFTTDSFGGTASGSATTIDENVTVTKDSEVATMEIETTTEELDTTEPESQTEYNVASETKGTTPQSEVSSEGTTENSGNVIIQVGSESRTTVESTPFEILSSEEPAYKATTVIFDGSESSASPIPATSPVPEQVSGETMQNTVGSEVTTEVAISESTSPEAATDVVKESSTPFEVEIDRIVSTEESTSPREVTDKPEGSSTGSDGDTTVLGFTDLPKSFTSSEEETTESSTDRVEESATATEGISNSEKPIEWETTTEYSANTTVELTTITTTTPPGTTDDFCEHHVCLEGPWLEK
ncbi:hypothetical protein CAEBREN_11582 [Caenorhabditis brenneri]|uniref:Uncharacterized protein n=1 Tax=Caenorhabditis brenneri TaxID=135651 RepID=G0NH98_CAEBE|nr:hypothetical protein CAEBREN_11582 [Caenorhabditis brenneri]